MKTRTILVLALLAAGSAQGQSTTTMPPGRLLASNCFQCHGTNGSGGFEKLAGMSSGEIVSELKEMRSKLEPDIMAIHARGYTDAQLQLIGNYFASLGSSTQTSSSAVSLQLPFASTDTKREANEKPEKKGTK